MLRRIICSGLVLLGVTILASCTSPEAAAKAVPTLSEAHLLSKAQERADGYPGVTLSDYTVNTSGDFACAYLHFPSKPPHVASTFVYKGRVRVSGPFLWKADSWDLPENAALSLHRLKQCDLMGAALPPR